jgi:hypothetical protein
MARTVLAGPERRLLNVVKPMKAAFNGGYRRSPRQNRLSAHAGYGSLLTCGDVQASGAEDRYVRTMRLRR